MVRRMSLPSQTHYTGILESVGFKGGRSNASVFYRADGVRVVVHGDNFLALRDRTGLDELDHFLENPMSETVRYSWR